MYVLRTSPRFDNPLLNIGDTLRRGLSLLLIVELSDKQWKQANLPVHMEGLGMRSAGMLATSGYMASATATLPLHDAISSISVHGEVDTAVKSAILVWTKTSQSTVHVNALEHIQTAWSDDSNCLQ